MTIYASPITAAPWQPDGELLSQLEQLQKRQNHELGWSIYDEPRPKQVRAWFMREDDGYSVCVPDLPGVASQGGTLDEAESRIREAMVGALSVYRDQGRDIPWDRSMEPAPAGVLVRWIVVNG